MLEYQIERKQSDPIQIYFNNHDHCYVIVPKNRELLLQYELRIF